ncbi:MAG: YXWGXW repeat-containing protein [Bryobacteraceae bacterium]
MKRSLLLVPVFAILTMAGCAARANYYVASPPPPRVEVYGYAPGPGYVWVSGFWDWRGRWVWAPGRWLRPPHRGAHWVPSRWDRGRHGYVFVRGYWR